MSGRDAEFTEQWGGGSQRSAARSVPLQDGDSMMDRCTRKDDAGEQVGVEMEMKNLARI